MWKYLFSKRESGFVDFYEITMGYVYWKEMPDAEATFELSVRELPENRNYFIASGLEYIIKYLLNFRFSKSDINYLMAHPVLKKIDKKFFHFLKDLRFTGNLWAVPEGTVFFPGEPVLRVTSSIIEAQIFETAILNLFTYSTLISSKAARIYYAASFDGKKRTIIEFGARRAPGILSSVIAARASYISGFDGTSNVLAGEILGIPTFGTMAHSFILSFENEEIAFKKYYNHFPGNTILLIDTFNSEKAALKISETWENIKSVRIDSGDLIEETKKVREILDKKGLKKTGIFLSGDLDEYKIYEIVKRKIPVDGFGVGTRLVTSSDSSYISSVYKIVEIKRGRIKKGVAKLSEGKITYPGKKQVVRILKNDKMKKDVIIEEDEKIEGEYLLKEYIRKGKLVKKLPKIDDIKNYCLREIEKLPESLKDIYRKNEYPVIISKRLGNNLEKIKEIIGNE